MPIPTSTLIACSLPTSCAGCSNLPGSPTVGDVQRAGDGMVETEPGLEPVSEEGEAAGNEQRLGADATESGEHALGARRELQTLVVDARERSHVEPREQRDAALEALA